MNMIIGDPPPAAIVELEVPRLPAYMVALHRLARLGKATRYSKSKRLLQFDLDTMGPFAAKWSPDLNDIVRISIIYRDPAEKRVLCL
jgi:hypothetical protein